MQPNTLFSLATRIINHTGQHLFLTGNAGTGKTTFLRYIRENTPKKAVVVAPTGVAAINAGGVTMHSFFQLPFGMFLPEAKNYFGDENNGSAQVVNKNTLFKNIRFNKDKIRLLRELELLIIDEVSMLRADALDAIDTILRHFRRQSRAPFGGVQVLYIGDLYQLPPVLKQDEARAFYEHYRTPFFFDALVAQEAPPQVVELKHIYRQSDETFIRILNAIRNNNAGYDELDLLHEKYMPHVQPDDGVIVLTTHNQKADETNRSRLEALPGAACSFEAVITGDFSEHAFPAEKELKLKAGAQIMFTKNDTGENRRWYNGKLATVHHMGEDGDVWVKLQGSNEELKLEHHVWKNIRFKYNTDSDEIEEDDLGSFKQYPVRLAWAITIHKSQGLTFEHAVVDAGQSFAPGQVYVALSRLTSLKGLILHSKIPGQGIAMPEAVIEFCAREKTEDALDAIVRQEEELFARQQLHDWFGMDKLHLELNALYTDYQSRNIPEKDKAMTWAAEMMAACKTMGQTAAGFQRQLAALLEGAPVVGFSIVHERMEAASAWFAKETDEKFLQPLAMHYKAWAVKQRTRQYLADLKKLEAVILHLKKGWAQATQLTQGLAGGSAVTDIKLNAAKEESRLSLPEGNQPSSEMSGTFTTTLTMFRAGKDVGEIAVARALAPGTIESHLARAIRDGNMEITEWIPQDKVDAILEALKGKSDSASLSELKQLLPADVTYNELRAVQAHRAGKRTLA